jgi:predicted  nucleic acid-binding Zn-ribbon protein
MTVLNLKTMMESNEVSDNEPKRVEDADEKSRTQTKSRGRRRKVEDADERSRTRSRRARVSKLKRQEYELNLNKLCQKKIAA